MTEYSKRDPAGVPHEVRQIYARLFAKETNNALGHSSMDDGDTDSHSDSGAGDRDRIGHVVSVVNKLFDEIERQDAMTTAPTPDPTPIWSDARIIAEVSDLMLDRELLRRMRDDYEQHIAAQAAEIERLRAELAAAQQWEPVNPVGMVNGEYDDAEIKLCYRRYVEGAQPKPGEE